MAGCSEIAESSRQQKPQRRSRRKIYTFGIVPRFGPAAIKIPVLGTARLKLGGDPLNRQFGGVEMVELVSSRNLEDPVDMMQTAPWLSHRLCRAKPILVRCNRFFRSTGGERRHIDQHRHESR